MNVFVLYYMYYDDFEILGTYSSRDKAFADIEGEVGPYREFENFVIEEFEVI